MYIHMFKGWTEQLKSECERGSEREMVRFSIIVVAFRFHIQS